MHKIMEEERKEMFQLGFSIANEHLNWFRTVEDVFGIRIKKAGGIYAEVSRAGRTLVSVACESCNKSQILAEIKTCLTDMYATVVKYDYLRNAIKLPLDVNSYNLLIHTLVAFDRENEREIIDGAFVPSDDMSLDGIFYFRLRELSNRWDEISALAKDNAPYLIDEDTLNELIRFLISAVNPKIMRLDISQNENNYNVSGQLPESEFEYNIIGTEQLLLYLIDIAPLELHLNGNFTDKRLYERLIRIFDAKRGDNCEAIKR